MVQQQRCGLTVEQLQQIAYESSAIQLLNVCLSSSYLALHVSIWLMCDFWAQAFIGNCAKVVMRPLHLHPDRSAFCMSSMLTGNTMAVGHRPMLELSCGSPLLMKPTQLRNLAQTSLQLPLQKRELPQLPPPPLLQCPLQMLSQQAPQVSLLGSQLRPYKTSVTKVCLAGLPGADALELLCMVTAAMDTAHEGSCNEHWTSGQLQSNCT